MTDEILSCIYVIYKTGNMWKDIMDHTLVIVESPAKANTISRYLGKSYKVAASVGHIRDLPASTLGVDIDNDFKPRYITMRGKENVVRDLRNLKKESSSVLLATDPDREGEAIAWHLANILKIDETTPCRITFNEITKKSVEDALNSPHQIDMDLVNAQQARRILDRLVGYELSPLLWKKIRKGLSAGRVQSVTTKIIIDREREIKAFIPVEYWLITVHLCKKIDDPVFRVRYHGELEDNKVVKYSIDNAEQAEDLIKDLTDADYIVHKVTKRESKRQSKPPYTTSTLQQEASRKLGFTSARTMRIAQQLYEGVNLRDQGATALITYLRTDSVRISPIAIEAARNYIEKEHGNTYLPNKPRYFKNKKAAQDAHECIRPAHFDLSPQTIRNQLTDEQYRLYKLIWDKFIASQMNAAIFDTTSADVKAKTHIFRVRGETMKFPGWMKQYGMLPDMQEEETDELTKENLPDLEIGDQLIFVKLDSEQKFTKPPARFTEATLIRILEELGIGRPSTYAPTISTILNRRYIDKDGRFLIPTDLGFLVTELLEEHFTKIIDPYFTAEMEENLDKVETGEKDWIKLLHEFYPEFHSDVEKADKSIDKVEIPVVQINEKCPECTEGNLVIKHGRFGKFVACDRYPNCNYTRAIEVEAPGICPLCGSGLLAKRAKKRRSSKFYVCDKKGKDPDCKFISWDLPSGKNCSVCGSYTVKKKFRGKEYEKCSNAECTTNKKTKNKKETADTANENTDKNSRIKTETKSNINSKQTIK